MVVKDQNCVAKTNIKLIFNGIIWPGHDKVVDILAQSEVDINMKNKAGKTALHVAIEAGKSFID